MGIPTIDYLLKKRNSIIFDYASEESKMIEMEKVTTTATKG